MNPWVRLLLGVKRGEKFLLTSGPAGYNLYSTASRVCKTVPSGGTVWAHGVFVVFTHVHRELWRFADGGSTLWYLAPVTPRCFEYGQAESCLYPLRVLSGPSAQAVSVCSGVLRGFLAV